MESQRFSEFHESIEIGKQRLQVNSRGRSDRNSPAQAPRFVSTQKLWKPPIHCDKTVDLN